jgi:hypothetical protein
VLRKATAIMVGRKSPNVGMLSLKSQSDWASQTKAYISSAKAEPAAFWLSCQRAYFLKYGSV